MTLTQQQIDDAGEGPPSIGAAKVTWNAMFSRDWSTVSDAEQLQWMKRREVPIGEAVVSGGGGGAVSSVNTRTGAVVGLAEDSAVVHLTGAQTVAGVKTFSSAPVVPSAAFPESAVSGLTTDLAGKLAAASNLSDVASAATARGNLGAAVALPMTASGQYFFPTFHTSTSGVTLPLGSLLACPWIVTKSVTLDRIGAGVVTAGDTGAKYRVGVYGDNGSCYPGALILDAGQLIADSNVAAGDLTVSQAFAPGLYWMVGVSQNWTTTGPLIRSLSGAASMLPQNAGTSDPTGSTALGVGYAMTGVTGALPSNFSATIVVATTLPRIYGRLA